MSPDIPINERVAAMEPQLEDLKADVIEFRIFKDNMIQQLAELTTSIKTMSLKISLITGCVMFALNQIAQWGFSKLLR